MLDLHYKRTNFKMEKLQGILQTIVLEHLLFLKCFVP